MSRLGEQLAQADIERTAFADGFGKILAITEEVVGESTSQAEAWVHLTWVLDDADGWNRARFVGTLATALLALHDERTDLAEARDFHEQFANALDVRLNVALAERDEARAEVVQLGRESENLTAALKSFMRRIDEATAAQLDHDAATRLLAALDRPWRPWTDDEVITKEDGTKTTRVHVKRACNGCGDLLGDVTDAEIDRAVAGLPPEDVRGECWTCTPLGALRAALEEERIEPQRCTTCVRGCLPGPCPAAELVDRVEELPGFCVAAEDGVSCVVAGRQHREVYHGGIPAPVRIEKDGDDR